MDVSYIRMFLKKYKFALLEHILRDHDFNIDLYFENNKFTFNKSKPNKSQQYIGNPRRITKKELEDYVGGGMGSRQKYLTDYHVFIEEDVGYIYKELNSLVDLSRAKGVLWSDSLIDKYLKDWEWNNLSRHSSILWTKKRILKYQKYLSFQSLSYNPKAEIDSELLYLFEEKWDWNGISGHPFIINQLESTILEHPKAVWINPISGNSTDPIHLLNDTYTNGGRFSIKPCICTNPSIKWTIEKFKKYESKIDLWLLSLYAKLEQSLIYEVAPQLDEKRIYQTNYIRWSDWSDEVDLKRSCWENICINKNIVVNVELIKFLAKNKVTTSVFEGNARSGRYTSIEHYACEFIKGNNLDITFYELIMIEKHLSPNIMSKTVIDENIFKDIIKPAFVEDKNLIRQLLENMYWEGGGFN